MNKKISKTYKILIFTVLTTLAIFCNPTKVFAKTSIYNAEVRGIGTYSYTGNAIIPNIKVIVKDKILIKGTDYTAYCYNNINAGTGYIEITGKGDYEGKITKEFTIKSIDILNCNINVQESCTYSGEARKPNVTVRFNGKYLKEETDYSLEYSNNTEVGTAKVIIYGQRNFIGTVTKKFQIKQASIKNAAVTVSPKTSTYTGKACNPSVTVRVNGKLLTIGKDYGITYLNNTKPGNGIIQIAGKGNYVGNINKTFIIKKVEIKNTKITISPEKFTYTGEYFKPKVAVIYRGETLKEGTDYKVTYSNNSRVGKGNIIITGLGNYCGTYNKKFTILPCTISSGDVTISYTETAYTGRTLVPEVTVKYNGKKLSRGSDYIVTYSDNGNAGTAKVIVKGRGNYQGNVTKTFIITKRNINSNNITKTVKSATYTGNPIEANVSLKYNGKTLKKGTDYTLKYEQNTNVAGNPKVTITGIGNFEGNYTTSFNINPKNIRNTTISFEKEYVYTGKEVIPTINIKDGDKSLIQGKDYTITFENNTNIGTGRFTVKGINNYTGSVTLSFRITRKSITDEDVTITYNNEWKGKDLNEKTDIEKLQLSIKYKGRELVQNTDYRLRIKNGGFNQYGKNKFTIVGLINFTGTIEGEIVIKPTDEQLVEILESLIGTKYTFYGGNSPEKGFNCSGLVQYIYGLYGYTLPGSVQKQWYEGHYVQKSDIQVGDLIFFHTVNGKYTHVAIYVGDGKMIHAANSRTGVIESNLSDWEGGYAGARRVFDN